MRLDSEEPVTDEISLAPLIDCVFLLLIFFMVTMSTGEALDQEPQPLPLLLPEARAHLDERFRADTVIEVDSQGQYWIERRRIDVGALHERLKRLAASQPDASVRIDADGTTGYEHVAHLVDLCQFIGLTRVALGSRKPPPRRKH